MINTGFLKIILFCFKILYYSNEVKDADIEVLQEGRYEFTLHYETQETGLVISALHRDSSEKLMTVQTIDNALYKVLLPGGDELTLDLADLYMGFEWELLGKNDFIIQGEEGPLLDVKVGSNNVFFLAPGENMLFVINRGFFK